MIESENIEEQILIKLSYIEKQLQRIDNEIAEIKLASINMNKHITFVETLYQTLRHPLNKILSYFS